MNTSVQFVTLVSRYLARMGGLLILLSAILVSLDVIFRNLFKLSIFESFELSGYAFAIATSLGLAWALISKAHIRIEVLYNALPLKARSLLDVCALAVLTAVAASFAYYGVQVVGDSVELGARSNSTLHVPLAIPQALWLLGLLWFALCSLVLWGFAVRSVITGQHQQVQSMLGIASVAEEVEASMEGVEIDLKPRTVVAAPPPTAPLESRPLKG
jgi:TRAP-type C4-dicarboxylate transport system permease small subunit